MKKPRTQKEIGQIYYVFGHTPVKILEKLSPKGYLVEYLESPNGRLGGWSKRTDYIPAQKGDKRRLFSCVLFKNCRN